MASKETCSLEDKQNFQTPEWCCDYMVSLLPKNANRVLEPTPGAGNLVHAIQKAGLKAVRWDDYQNIIWDENLFDSVVMNPPFTPMEVGYKIFQKCLENSETVIALLPWLAIINSQKRAKIIKEFGLVSVSHLPRSTFPGTRVQCCVLYLQKGFLGHTIFNIL